MPRQIVGNGTVEDPIRTLRPMEDRLLEEIGRLHHARMMSIMEIIHPMQIYVVPDDATVKKTVAPVNDCRQYRSRPGGLIRVKDGKCIECGREYPTSPEYYVKCEDSDICLIPCGHKWLHIKNDDCLSPSEGCKDRKCKKTNSIIGGNAILTERERCAKIAETYCVHCKGYSARPPCDTCWNARIAAKIREGT